MLVVVDQEAVFRMNADHGSADFEDLRDFRELVFEDVGDLFFEVLVEVLGSEGGGRESVPHNVVHASEGGVGESGREGFEADEFKFFFERRAEAWRVCEVDQVVDLCGQGYNLCDCALDVEGAGTFFLWGRVSMFEEKERGANLEPQDASPIPPLPSGSCALDCPH